MTIPRRILPGALAVFAICCSLVNGGSGEPPVDRTTPTSSPSETAIPSPTRTPSPTHTPEPTRTATVSRTRFPSRTASPTNPPGQSVYAACRTSVDGFDNLRKNLDLPDHLTSGEPYRKSGDFDPNRYFSVLNHLKMESGYVLDYIYFADELGGKPMLYARRTADAPFHSYAEYLESIGEETSGERSYATLPHAFDFLDRVQIDGLEEGYFQFMALALLGDQFYLSWHALYNDFILMCDSSDIERVREELDGLSGTPSEEEWEQAAAIDYTPTVLIREDTVVLRYVFFTKWGGFTENIATMDSRPPYYLLDLDQNVLVPYDCGIMF